MDEQRVAELYRDHVPAMRRFAFLMLDGDRDRAEDIVHDAFIRSVTRMSAMRDQDRFAAYLRRSVANSVASWGRRRGVERRWLARHMTAAAGSALPDLAADDVVGTDFAVQLLRLLPTRQRMAVTARICLDLSEAQTADLLGCSTGTVKSLTSRGLATLRLRADVDAGGGRQSEKLGEVS